MRIARGRDTEPVQALFTLRRAPAAVTDQDHRLPGIDQPAQTIDRPCVRCQPIVQHTPLIDQKGVVALGHGRKSVAEINRFFHALSPKPCHPEFFHRPLPNR